MIDLGAGTTSACGGEGNDIISGGKAGFDTIAGGPGDDVIYGGTSTDAIDCGEGTDTAYVSTPGEGGKMTSCETVIYGDPAADDPGVLAHRGRTNAGLAVGGQPLARAPTPSSPHNSVGPKGTAGPDEMAGSTASTC